MWKPKPCFRFEIGDLSKKKAAINSKVFVSGGCEWYINVNLKGDSRCDDQLPLYLCVANPKSLGRGWERSAKFYFVLLNQSDKELYKSPIGKKRCVFCAKDPAWGFPKTLPLGKFQEKGFLDKDRLIIDVYIKVFIAFDGVGVVSETNKTMDINGFQVLASQVTPVRKIFAEPPDLAEDFKPKNPIVDYVHSMIKECNLRKRAQQLEERVEDVSLERKKTDDADGSRVQQLEERVEDVSLERKKTDDADGSWVQQLEERVKNLELMDLGFKVDCLKSNFEDVYLEMKKSDDDDRSRVQQLEECVKNLKMMVTDLKVELDKEKAKSCADGFLLVDVNEVA